jgi:hypothetical protein
MIQAWVGSFVEKIAGQTEDRGADDSSTLMWLIFL